MPKRTATWEEASQCPKCSSQGEEVAQYLQGRTVVFTLECPAVYCPARNRDREGMGYRWIVQRHRDGSVPVRDEGDKEYPSRDSFGEALANRTLEQIAEEDPVIARELNKFRESN